MTLSETFAHPTPQGNADASRRGDLLRLAFMLMLFANVALGLMLAARAPGSPLAEGPVATQWHGNSVGVIAR